MRTDEQYEVTGPGCEGRRAPSAGSGLSLAQTLASRAAEPGTWYVRGPESTFTVTLAEDGVVTTAPLAKPGSAPETTLQEATA